MLVLGPLGWQLAVGASAQLLQYVYSFVAALRSRRLAAFLNRPHQSHAPLRDSDLVPCWVCDGFLVRTSVAQPRKELHWSLVEICDVRSARLPGPSNYPQSDSKYRQRKTRRL